MTSRSSMSHNRASVHDFFKHLPVFILLHEEARTLARRYRAYMVLMLDTGRSSQSQEGKRGARGRDRRRLLPCERILSCALCRHATGALCSASASRYRGERGVGGREGISLRDNMDDVSIRAVQGRQNQRRRQGGRITFQER